ncbi:MAG: hypothetical protein U0I51_10305 [Muricomes sp.]|nr:hypothetical protein [Muricomes sp.]
MSDNKIRLGIGFATGRKAFRKVMNSYIYSWNEFCKKNSLDKQVQISLFVAYDLSYANTQSTDYTNLSQDIVDSFEEIVFLDEKTTKREVLKLVAERGITEADTKRVFASGYAGKRNAILYAAIQRHQDCLLFLDDDEYPVAVTHNSGTCLWSGQYVIPMHIKEIMNADITNGYHCGYISPIPRIRYNEILTERMFQRFITAISNDVINWDSIQAIMDNGGVTYASAQVLAHKITEEVEEKHHCKFITGSNLCINLSEPERIFPFYNPPGARGEDTFFSTLLTDSKVLRIPCYAFHDGFSAYRHLLDGVLPTELDSISAESGTIATRFYNACIGWVRYKPLLLYITDREGYDEKISLIQHELEEIVPQISKYLDYEDFHKLITEFQKYTKNTKKHFQNFKETQISWKKIMELFS